MTNTDILMEILAQGKKMNEAFDKLFTVIEKITANKEPEPKQEENLFNPAEVKASLPKRTYNKKKNL